MPLRRLGRTPAYFAALLALWAAVPTMQWCAGPWPALTPEQLAACAIAEYSGCDASSCGAASACEATTASECVAIDDATLALAFLPDAAARAEACGGPADDAPAGPRAFCVGNPNGGAAVRPAPDLDASPVLVVLAVAAALDPPTPARHPAPADRAERPPPERHLAAAPVRGPPSA